MALPSGAGEGTWLVDPPAQGLRDAAWGRPCLPGAPFTRGLLAPVEGVAACADPGDAAPFSITPRVWKWYFQKCLKSFVHEWRNWQTQRT